MIFLVESRNWENDGQRNENALARAAPAGGRANPSRRRTAPLPHLSSSLPPGEARLVSAAVGSSGLPPLLLAARARRLGKDASLARGGVACRWSGGDCAVVGRPARWSWRGRLCCGWCRRRPRSPCRPARAAAAWAGGHIALAGWCSGEDEGPPAVGWRREQLGGWSVAARGRAAASVARLCCCRAVRGSPWGLDVDLGCHGVVVAHSGGLGWLTVAVGHLWRWAVGERPVSVPTPLVVVRALPSLKGWPSPSRGPVLVSRPAAGPSSSRARQQDRAHLAPGCRIELVSRPVQQGGSPEANFGRPIGSRRWGLPRGVKGEAFPFVSLVGVATGLG
ncbi:uncharacterized protein [Triticum aestivum]|uniref:uncharacterized protein n=1 Tax=Triticum aestivum TaxID=4565 RepID=UPI001D0352E8|nr:uncharacterized protein LOC123103271 [Triticum aestivum]